MRPPEFLETLRLRLRPPVMEDAPAIFEQYAQDAEVTRYLVWPPHRDIAETREFLRHCERVWRKGSAFPWAILRKEDHRLMGMIEARINEHGVNLGYALAKVFWGNGYMPEAIQALVDWALRQPEIYRVWAFCDVENHSSARVLEKSGMQREGLLKRWFKLPNRSPEPRDCYCYAKTK